MPGLDFLFGVNGAVAEVATVVGKEYDEGVIGDLFVVEELQDAPDIGVEVVDDGSIGLHAKGFVLAGGFGKFFPTAVLRGRRFMM